MCSQLPFYFVRFSVSRWWCPAFICSQVVSVFDGYRCVMRYLLMLCRSLLLYANKLSGSIPSTLGSLTGLMYVWYYLRAGCAVHGVS